MENCILNIGREKIEACAKFNYKGYEISFSTIFKPYSVFIYDKEDKQIGEEMMTVENAIAEVDKLTN